MEGFPVYRIGFNWMKLCKCFWLSKAKFGWSKPRSNFEIFTSIRITPITGNFSHFSKNYYLVLLDNVGILIFRANVVKIGICIFLTLSKNAHYFSQDLVQAMNVQAMNHLISNESFVFSGLSSFSTSCNSMTHYESLIKRLELKIIKIFLLKIQLGKTKRKLQSYSNDPRRLLYQPDHPSKRRLTSSLLILVSQNGHLSMSSSHSSQTE